MSASTRAVEDERRRVGRRFESRPPIRRDRALFSTGGVKDASGRATESSALACGQCAGDERVVLGMGISTRSS